MRIAVLHQPVSPDCAPDELDVLDQVHAVSASLKALGHEPCELPFALDLSALAASLHEIAPGCVFNLVESLDGDGRLIHLAPAFLDHLGLPYTGASAEALHLTTHKVLCKRWLHLAGIATPAWFLPEGDTSGEDASRGLPFPQSYIVKPLAEDASIGLDEGCLMMASSRADLAQFVRSRVRRLKTACFAERYIDGREFNLSLLASPTGVQALPPAEILFDLPETCARIVGYRAKWDSASPEYRGTCRTFAFPLEDTPLLARLKAIACRAWATFGLKGYARVDFRVDAQGRPWVLEINANPCISPDAGFVAAASEAGLDYPAMIARILEEALASCKAG